MDEIIEGPPLPSLRAMSRYAVTITALTEKARAPDVKLDLDRWFELPEYEAALQQAYSLKFVHGELSSEGFNFDLIDARPAEHLWQLTPEELRRYIHALWRCERHAHPYGSLVLEAVISGALTIAVERLAACGKLASS
jgi:hypothetical protein